MSKKRPRVALSTCWLSHRHEDGYAMLKEAAEMGFEYVELSHGIRLSLVTGILEALAEKIIKVSSIHNFCPLPLGLLRASPNAYQPSSRNKKEMYLWEMYTRKTIEFASEVEAPVIVAHMGSIVFFGYRLMRKLMMMSGGRRLQELKEDSRYQKYFKKVRKKAFRKEPKAIARVNRSIDSIMPLLKEKNLQLGIENREHLLELPFDENVGAFIDESREERGGVLGCWHDSGHAQLKEMMGIMTHREFLEENHAQIIGFHLKDVSKEGLDNQALGTGVVDFEMISKYIRPEHVVVLEVGPQLSREAVIESREYLAKIVHRNLSSG